MVALACEHPLLVFFFSFRLQTFSHDCVVRKTLGEEISYLGAMGASIFLLIKQILRGVKCFCKVWLNLIILVQFRILPPNSGKDQKKGFRCILVLSQSGISDFLLPIGYYLPKNRGGQKYFAPFRVKPEAAPPPVPLGSRPRLSAPTTFIHSLLIPTPSYGDIQHPQIHFK